MRYNGAYHIASSGVDNFKQKGRNTCGLVSPSIAPNVINGTYNKCTTIQRNAFLTLKFNLRFSSTLPFIKSLIYTQLLILLLVIILTINKEKGIVN